MVLSKSQVGLGTAKGQLKIGRGDFESFESFGSFGDFADRFLILCVSMPGWWRRLGAASCEGQELPHAFLFLALRLEPADFRREHI